MTMARSSILGGERAPAQPTGRDVESLGPSDRSDTGSDVQGELDLAPPVDLDRLTPVDPAEGDSDAEGTGERGAALPDEEAREGRDIDADRVQQIDDDTGDADAGSLDEVADLAASEDEDEEDDEDLDDERPT
jgi:hypothetical protein